MHTKSLICLALASGCSLESTDELNEVEQGLAAAPALVELGDFDNDGVANTGRDAVNYLSSMGLEVFTYGLVDDVHNKGTAYARRSLDYQVRTYADACLDSWGLARRPYPADLVPGITELAKGFARLPQDVVRQMGKDGWQLHIMGELGALSHRFDGTANTWQMQAVFGYASATTYWGRARFAPPGSDSDDDFGAWESLDNVVRSGDVVTFRRAAGNQSYRLTLGAGNQKLAGTFSDGATTYQVDLSARTIAQQQGATTARYGFGPGDAHTCTASTNDSHGNTGRAIVYKIGSIADQYTIIHEHGHVIDSMIHDGSLRWTADDAETFDTLFGTGMTVSSYAASNQAEDFGDTYATFVYGSNYDQTLEEAQAGADSWLRAKLAYVSQRAASPETGRAVARHPVTNVLHALTLGSDSRVAGAIASNESTLLWYASTAQDGLIRIRSLDGAGTFSAWRATNHYARLPVALAPLNSSTMALLMTGDDHNIYYRLFSSTSGALLGTGSIPGVRTAHQVAAANLGGAIYLFAIEETSGNVAYTRLDASMTVQSWSWLDMQARSVTAARTKRADGTHEITVAVVDKRFRAQSRSILPGTFSQWVPEPTGAKIAPNMGLSDTRVLYVRGFDGNFYTKQL